jgi:arylsulfatase A-like enzyme
MHTKNLFKPRTVHEQILHLGGETEWKYMVQSYLACINYVDTQIGLLLEALKNNPRARNTVIVLTGDHGWNLGEKEHWCKAALWRDTTRVPYIVVVPGVTKEGSVSNQPISLVDTFPTLCDLVGINKPDHIEGKSILPSLVDPTAKRTPAFISYGPENIAVQTERYRYIRYEDGSEELYDHKNDPHEWTNQISNPEFAAIKEKLKIELSAYLNN